MIKFLPYIEEVVLISIPAREARTTAASHPKYYTARNQDSVREAAKDLAEHYMGEWATPVSFDGEMYHFRNTESA